MNLDDIPRGSLCVLDADILIYAEQGASLQAQRLMRRIEEPRRDWQPVWQETIQWRAYFPSALALPLRVTWN